MIDNNDVLKRLRYAFHYNDMNMQTIVEKSGRKTDIKTIIAYLKPDEEEGFLVCPNDFIIDFLDGLILDKRGPRPKDSPPEIKDTNLSNNLILRKLKIALNLRDDDMVAILKKADFAISVSELNAFFRKKGHRNYVECGDQILRNFIRGISLR